MPMKQQKQITIGANALAVLCIAARSWTRDNPGHNEATAVQLALMVAESKYEKPRKPVATETVGIRKFLAEVKEMEDL